MEITELDFAGAAAVGTRMRAVPDDWGGAHAVHLAQPSVEWPRGRPVLTRTPTRYRGTGVGTIRIDEVG